MKGVIFTEFLEMVEGHHSAEMVDDIIDDSNLASKGAYSAVGRYDHHEMVALVMALSKRTGVAVPELLKQFGEYLFQRFSETHPYLISISRDAFTFLSSIETVVHTEVRKLYPEAELPEFQVDELSDNRLVLTYKSKRHFEDLAEGLIRGCLRYYGERATLNRHTQGSGEGRAEQFVLIKMV